MPGIAGIISRRPPEECKHLLNAMIDSMNYEPFYVSGTCFVPENGVYGGWVAHGGSFAARQSARADQDGVSVLFSGEYFPPLSCDQSASTDPKGSCLGIDRLVRLYKEEGDHFVDQLNGTFSGLLIDQKRNRVLLFNDRYGIERLYFYEKDGTIYFASEAKALLRVVPELRAFDDEGVAQFLTFGCTLGERTLFQNVHLLQGGSLWVFTGNTDNCKKQYFSPDKWESQTTLTEEAFHSEFVETFKRILPRYLTSDYSIGISLTGGLDTRMIMACFPGTAFKPACYTFSGLTEKTLDSRLANRVAQVCGFDHQILRIGKDFLSNYGKYVDRTAFVTDGYAGALSAHEVYLNAQARQISAIRLTGNFGSEVLRSMSTFKPIGLSNELIDAGFYQTFRSSVESVLSKKVHPVTFAAFMEIPWNIFGIPAVAKSQLTLRTPYLDNEIVGLAFRAPANSRLSTLSALRLVNECNPELGKIPTDRALVLGSRGVSHMAKRLFSETTFKLDYFHKEGLPYLLSPFDPLVDSFSKFGLLGLHKFLPYRRWFQHELATYISDVLMDPQTQQLPYWNSRFISSLALNHVNGRKNYTREIHAVVTLEAIERLLLRGSSESA